MIIPDLHRRPVALDTQKHRQTKLQLPVRDWSALAGMNAMFVTAAETAQAARDYPVVLIKAGKTPEGETEYAPVAVFGLSAGENLVVADGGRWRASHLPALLQVYPMATARVDDKRYAICIDEASAALVSGEAGTRLFGDDGEPTAYLKSVQQNMERLEGQIVQTQGVCRRLAALGLLQERRFDATLPDGRKLSMDGFLTVEEERVKALPDATVLELHREGLLGLIHAHWISLGNMTRLVQWRVEREAAANKG